VGGLFGFLRISRTPALFLFFGKRFPTLATPPRLLSSVDPQGMNQITLVQHRTSLVFGLVPLAWYHSARSGFSWEPEVQFIGHAAF